MDTAANTGKEAVTLLIMDALERAGGIVSYPTDNTVRCSVGNWQGTGKNLREAFVGLVSRLRLIAEQEAARQ